MKKPQNKIDARMLLKFSNSSRTNLYEWLESILEDYCEEQALEDCTSIEHIKARFYIDLDDGFLYVIPTLLHKFLIEKGIGHIIEYHPPLETPTNIN